MAATPIKRYKQKLVSSMLNSVDLISLIDSSYIEDGECVETKDLMYKQIFPYYYIPDTQNSEMSYVIIKVNALNRINNMYKNVEVFISVICHQRLMYVENGGGTRIDLMGEAIENLFDSKDDFGFGEMVLKSSTEGSITNVHRCRELRFVVEEFNSNACREE